MQLCVYLYTYICIISQRELHGAAMLGFVKQGYKWSWKMSLFAGMFRYMYVELFKSA